MPRNKREIIAIDSVTGERRTFSGIYEMAKALKASKVHVLNCIYTGQCVRGWYVYDTPDKIRERIKELEEQIRMLEDNK